MSDAYKEYYDVGNESNGIFRFGISWVLAEEKKNREMKGHQGNVAKGIEIISINVRGIGESDKKGWIKSIIMIEQPDVIGMQETKSGSVDDYWINDWWGGKDYGYAQLPAIGNSGGIILVWDLRVFICKEAVGNERFVAVRGSWKGKRNNKCNIRGLMVDGVWCEDPKVIKAEMARHYKRLFFEGKVIHLVFCSNRIEKISRDDATLLEKAFEEKEKMGFGDKWCKWVDSCLRSSSMSILVNGSPSDEFGLERGIRQGDPLSSFLFILAAKGLNAIVNEAV
ncbi:RNA-directed DNA polymerase, eukaryota [Tanacetum coccineum]